jgi:hypothetical protein
MFTIQEVNNINAPRETALKCPEFGAEVTQLVPRHSATLDEAPEPWPERSQPGRQVVITIGSAMQDGVIAPRIQVTNELNVTRSLTPM